MQTLCLSVFIYFFSKVKKGSRVVHGKKTFPKKRKKKWSDGKNSGAKEATHGVQFHLWIREGQSVGIAKAQTYVRGPTETHKSTHTSKCRSMINCRETRKLFVARSCRKIIVKTWAYIYYPVTAERALQSYERKRNSNWVGADENEKRVNEPPRLDITS